MSSNFPNGFASGVSIRGIPLLQAHPGSVFWVSNSSVLPKGGNAGSNGNDGSRLKPFATITYALTQCLADRGDIIVVGAGHSESTAAGGAGALTLNVAGTAIVGLGVGTKQAKILSTGATDTIVISAANMSFVNLHFEAGVAAVATGLDVSAVDGLSFEGCIFSEGNTAGTFNYVDVINLATGADNISFRGTHFFGRDAGGDQFITGVAHDRFFVDNCLFYQAVAQTTAVPVVDATGNVTNLEIKNSHFYNNKDGATCLSLAGSACTGVVRDCSFGSIDTVGFLIAAADATGAHFFNCTASGDANAWGAPSGGAQIYGN